jgi:DNA-directed RNA polymerase specialized sigma24 family protein
MRADKRLWADRWTIIDDGAAMDRADAERCGRQLANALLSLRREEREVFLLCTLGDLSYE